MAEAFTWGQGGETETTSSRSRRRLAEALLMQGTSTAPVQHWTQGLNRVAQALIGGYDLSREDARERQLERESADIVASHPAFAGSGGTVRPASSGVAKVAAALTGNTAPGKIYSNDEPSPLDPRPAGPVMPTAKVWGDAEAEAAGLYEPRPVVKTVAAAMPAVATPQDPGTIPLNAQPAQGYAIPGQQPVAPAGAQMPPVVASWVQRAIRNPATRASAMQVLAQYSKPRETYGEERDAQGNVWSVNQQTGQRTVALKRDKPPEPPTSVQEHNHYLQTFRPTAEQPNPMGYDSWATAKARAAATNVTMNAGNGSEKQMFDEMVERSKSARATAQGLTGIRNAREAIEGGAITGFKADDRLSLQKAAKYFGVPIGEASKIENSEVFKSAIAPQIAAVLKATVGNANISDSDRRFAERAAGGSLDLDETSIKRLLDIMERASTSSLEEHQNALDAVYPDPEKHKRERALFGVRVTGGGRAAGTTDTGIGWKVK